MPGNIEVTYSRRYVEDKKLESTKQKKGSTRLEFRSY